MLRFLLSHLKKLPQTHVRWASRSALLGLLFLLCACGGDAPVAAQVGETTITAQEVTYQQAVMALRSGDDFPAHLALFQLIEQALMAEVGRVYEVSITPEMLAAEAARVQAESRDPATLAQIQDIFGEDQAAYQRLVLAPILVNQLLHARFSLGHDIQVEPLGRARQALVDAQTSALNDLAETYGGAYRQLQIVAGRLQTTDESNLPDLPETEALPAELAQYDVALPDYDQEFIEQVLADLTVGELHPRVVEDRTSFMVVRLLSREGQDATLEALVIPKLAFDPWFQTHSQRVPLEIFDQDLLEMLLAKVDVPYITDRLK